MSNWLTAIIVLLIIAILIDGYRRRNKNRLGVSPALKKRQRNPEPDYEEETEEPPSYSSELPNGGARVIGFRDPSDAPSRERRPSARELKEQRRREDAAKRTPEQASLNLDESVPLLMESVEQPQDQLSAYDSDDHGRIEPSFSAQDDYVAEEDAVYDNKQAQDQEEHYQEDDDLYDEDDYDEEARDESEYHDEDEAEDDYEDLEEDPQAAAPQSEPEEVLIINIMAHKGEVFRGDDLLDIVLKCGLRYGSMDIFHRYSDNKGEGALLFSMANMVKPGTFDLDAMDEFTTPGVTLFMTLPINADSMQSFDLMADTAQAISQTLGGELKDEQRSVMTRQTLEHCRQRIRDFERKKLFRRPR
jgi:cell division protein ZipA